jgi:hypothetical protein
VGVTAPRLAERPLAAFRATAANPAADITVDAVADLLDLDPTILGRGV